MWDVKSLHKRETVAYQDHSVRKPNAYYLVVFNGKYIVRIPADFEFWGAGRLC